MANKQLFQHRDPNLVRNEAGGFGYQLTAKGALAQYAVTGCLYDTYYATDEVQLEKVLELCDQCPPEFVAKTAVYSRWRGYMKDMPALLAAYLAAKQHYDILDVTFPVVIDNGRMLRNFCQILRSGRLGRRSFGRHVKRLVNDWILSRSPEQIMRAGVGNNPSLADILRMTHPRPANELQAAVFRWVLNKNHPEDVLPEPIASYERWLAGNPAEPLPDVPVMYLMHRDLTPEQWLQVVERAGLQWTLKNLATLNRRGVLEQAADVIRSRFSAEEVHRARLFPYQIWTAYRFAPPSLTQKVLELLDASFHNVPEIPGNGAVFVDVSGSMSSPVTGFRGGVSTVVTVAEVAALFAVAMHRRNPQCRVGCFSDRANWVVLPEDTLQAMRSLRGSGGTNLSSVMPLISQNWPVDWLVIISDNQSWVDWANTGRGFYCEWQQYKARHPEAKLVLWDVQPYATVQAKPDPDVLLVGGFSENVFQTIGLFFEGKTSGEGLVAEIERLSLEDSRKFAAQPLDEAAAVD